MRVRRSRVRTIGSGSEGDYGHHGSPLGRTGHLPGLAGQAISAATNEDSCRQLHDARSRSRRTGTPQRFAERDPPRAQHGERSQDARTLPRGANDAARPASCLEYERVYRRLGTRLSAGLTPSHVAARCDGLTHALECPDARVVEDRRDRVFLDDQGLLPSAALGAAASGTAAKPHARHGRAAGAARGSRRSRV
jgi:hypothetical protein